MAPRRHIQPQPHRIRLLRRMGEVPHAHRVLEFFESFGNRHCPPLHEPLLHRNMPSKIFQSHTHQLAALRA